MSQVDPPPLGHIRIHSHAIGPLTAGDYELRVQQRIDVPEIPSAGQTAATHQLDDHVRPFEVTAPRFRMSGTELQSLFPPPFSRGAFSNRFAQAMCKRRTLPWDRDPDPDTTEREPWLALVVLTESEYAFDTDRPLTDATWSALRDRLGIGATQAAELGAADQLTVTGRVIRKSFPSRSDLPYLAHVREVNVRDTEYAGTDDDGFIAVVGSNRVLRGGLKYHAFLVSMEGQLGLLRPPHTGGADDGTTREIGPPQDTGSRVVLEADVAAGVLGTAGSIAYRPGLTVPLSQPVSTQPAVDHDTLATIRARGWDTSEVRRTAGDDPFVARLSEDVVVAGPAADVGVAQPLDWLPGDDDRHHFPVLAHWSFETLPGGDFETLMKRLDVGVLTSVDQDDEDAPTVIGTGHMLLDRTTREGDHVGSWYRGPMAPMQVGDRDDVPLFVADQAIRVGSDGIEDISYAAAFEVGRLLALASPSFVARLVSWRRRGSVAGWTGLRRDVLPDLLPPLDLERMALERYMTFGLIGQLLGGDGPFGSPWGPLGPLVNPAPMAAALDDMTDRTALERFGVPGAAIDAVLGPDAGLVDGAVSPAPGMDLGGVATFDDVLTAGLPGGLATSLRNGLRVELDGLEGMRGGGTP